MMISQGFIQHLKYLRENSWDFTTLKLFSPRISQNFYEKLLIDLLLECDHRKFSKDTAFIAKTYFDVAVTHFPSLNEGNASNYLVAALQSAIEVSQSIKTSDQSTIDFSLRYAKYPFQLKQIILAQLQIVEVVKTKQRIFTPYRYIPIFQPLIKRYDSQGDRSPMLIQLIDIAISLPKLILSSQEHIFMACFLTVFSKFISASELEMIRGATEYRTIVSIQRTLKNSVKMFQDA